MTGNFLQQQRLCVLEVVVLHRLNFEVTCFVLPQREPFAAITIMDFEHNADPAVLPDLTVNRNGNGAVRHDAGIPGHLDVKHLARGDDLDNRAGANRAGC